MANTSSPGEKQKLNVMHISAMYDIRDGKLCCKACRYVPSAPFTVVPVAHPSLPFPHSRRVERGNWVGATLFEPAEATATWVDIVGHVEREHPSLTQQVLALRPEQLRKHSVDSHTALMLHKKRNAAL